MLHSRGGGSPSCPSQVPKIASQGSAWDVSFNAFLLHSPLAWRVLHITTIVLPSQNGQEGGGISDGKQRGTVKIKGSFVGITQWKWRNGWHLYRPLKKLYSLLAFMDEDPFYQAWASVLSSVQRTHESHKFTRNGFCQACFLRYKLGQMQAALGCGFQVTTEEACSSLCIM